VLLPAAELRALLADEGPDDGDPVRVFRIREPLEPAEEVQAARRGRHQLGDPLDKQRLLDQSQELLRKGLDTLENYTK
jgi:hypothetical protein